MRTGTAMRGGTAAGRGPLRMKTGAVPGTSAGTQAAFLPQHNISVSDRPVTGQGIAGMKTAIGPGRQVQDSSFYIGLLRTKITDITKETRKIKTDMDTMQRDAGQYSQLERKYESLLKEVRNLEGTLADYNLAMDKLRTSTDPQEVRHFKDTMMSKASFPHTRSLLLTPKPFLTTQNLTFHAICCTREGDGLSGEPRGQEQE